MKAAEAINIVASCDDSYAQHLSVMLVSLLENNPGRRFRVFVLTTAEPGTLRKIAESCAGHDCSLDPVRVDPRLLSGVPVSDHITEAAYYRILLGDVLPPDVSRALYLDCDILVERSIAELWNLELGANVVAAVPNVGHGSEPLAKLGLTDEDYFNSGMLLVDLERWRRGQIGRTALAFVRDQPHRITWHDQCALNHVLRGSWLALQPKWNLQTHMIGAFRGYDFVATQEGLKRLEDAAIVHFTTNWKPWLYRCRHPHRAQYWRYLKRTPWRDYRMPDHSARAVIRMFVARHFQPLLRAYWALRR